MTSASSKRSPSAATRAPALARWMASERGRAIAAVAFALLASTVFFELAVIGWGESPLSIGKKLFAGTWGTSFGIGQVLFKATTIAIAGVAAQMALRAGLFHIGIDGCIAVAALAVGSVGASLPATISPLLAWPLLAVVAMVAGALWALPAAALRVRFGAHEVISGIMTNKIAASFVGLLLAKGLAEHASMHTRPLPKGARLPRLSDLFHITSLHGSALSIALVIALGLVVAWAFVARRTVFGRELLAIGAGSSVSRAVGIPVGARWLAIMALSGAAAGLAAMNDVMGYRGWAEEGSSAGVGFVGLSAALLGGSSPIGLVLASLLFATLAQGGLAINARLPMEIVDVLTAAVILLVAVAPRVLALADAGAPIEREAPSEPTPPPTETAS